MRKEFKNHIVNVGDDKHTCRFCKIQKACPRQQGVDSDEGADKPTCDRLIEQYAGGKMPIEMIAVQVIKEACANALTSDGHKPIEDGIKKLTPGLAGSLKLGIYKTEEIAEQVGVEKREPDQSPSPKPFGFN